MRPIPMPDLDRAEWFDVEVPADLERQTWHRVVPEDCAAKSKYDAQLVFSDFGRAVAAEDAIGLLALPAWEPIATGCGKLPRVHPRSYAARFARAEREFERKLEAYELAHFGRHAPDRDNYGACHSEVSVTNKPHPRSYGASLPMRGFSHQALVTGKCAALTRATKEDKAAWAARPLRYSATARVKGE